MSHHIICVTIDTDPDGLSGRTINRSAMEWRGLEESFDLSQELVEHESALCGRVALTWFVRADAQLRERFGSSSFLLETYDDAWKNESKRGNELAWHPHLYRQGESAEDVRLISDASEASKEIGTIWEEMKDFGFSPAGFRNGEAWHSPETMNMVEKLGMSYDSSAIPGRRGSDNHPMNWIGSPNEPFFPDPADNRVSGKPRRLLELPMNTWRIKAPWDNEPRLRYMNPTVHPDLFREALKGWKGRIASSRKDLYVWTLIFHPDEIMETAEPDGLIAHSRAALFSNLLSLVEALGEIQHTWEFSTMGAADKRWRAWKEPPS